MFEVKKKNILVNLTVIIICILFVIFIFIKINREGEELSKQTDEIREGLRELYYEKWSK